MRRFKSAAFLLFLAIVLSLSFASSIYAHNNSNIGMSEWRIKENEVEVSLFISTASIEQIKEWKEGKYRLESETDLKRGVNEIIQPYLDKKLSIWINNKKLLLKVAQMNKVEKDGAPYFEIVSSADGISWNGGDNQVKFEYRILFEESDNLHANIGEIYKPGSSVGIETIFTASTPSWTGTIKGASVAPALEDVDSPSHQPDSPIQSDNAPTDRSTHALDNAFQFIWLGIIHILTGYDHIMFLLSLIVAGLAFKEVIRIITSFTVAHSITLFLSAMKFVQINSRFVEAVIAFSICWIAFENIVRKKAGSRWLVTFGFGLIHGFGFAGVLQDFISSKTNLVYSVLSFNLGVEIGQLLLFLVVLPVLYAARKKLDFRKLTITASALIFLFGFIWLLERLTGYKWLWI